jgi:hypothetical protein
VFIIKFNKMIHNKWVWGAFAFIVAITFVGSGILFDLPFSRGANKGGVGTLNDKAVSRHAFDVAKMQAQFELRDTPDADVEYETWLRLAVLRFAEDLELSVSDAEVDGALKTDPLFAGPTGAFNANRYRMVLAQIGFSEATFLELYKAERLMGKVESVVMSGAWAVPSIAQEQARGMTDVYDFTLATYHKKVGDMTEEASEEESEDYYKGHREDYRVPERVAVRYVRFSADAFRNHVTLDENAVQDYYEDKDRKSVV